MLEVKFLGTNGSVQEKGSGNTSLLLRTEKTKLLIDASVHIQEAVEANVDAVIITHNHVDHVYGVPSLLHQLWLTGRTEALTIYAPKTVCPLVEEMVSLFQFRAKKNFFPLFVKTVEDCTFGDLTLSFFQTDHTDDSIGLLAEADGKRLLYTADTRPIKEPRPEWEGVDLLIHETSGLSEKEETLIKKGHSSGEDAGLLASKIQAGRLFLCHLPVKGKKEILEEAETVFPKTGIPVPLEWYTL